MTPIITNILIRISLIAFIYNLLNLSQKKQNNLKKKKFMLTTSTSFMLFTSASSASFTLNLHHRHTDSQSKEISKKKEFLSCHLLPQTFASSSGVVSSFACPNLYHTTHRITPPHRLSELCMELVNILELLWTTIQWIVFHDFPFSQFGFRIILMDFYGFMGFD